ncbi:phosphoserine phosphatase 1 [Clostridium sediminicola]|uniref:histidine phosphatase family protein n=1 Tax=Clostridium sediminicola TaxID=3114879 RepID=UPI0031F211CF
MTKLYLVRHGQTLWNLEGRLQGWKDSGLTDHGINQAKKAKKALEKIPFDAIYSSDRGRTLQTATIIAGDEKKIQKSSGLREMSFGEWEGQLIEDVKGKYSENYWALFNAADKYTSIGGEDYEGLKNRVVPEVNKIIEQNSGDNILIVSHALTIKTILSHFENRSFTTFWDAPFVEGGSISVVEITDEARIKLYADASHLNESEDVKLVV